MQLSYYKIAKATDIEELEQKINGMMDADFFPKGGICVLTDSEGNWTEFYQAMLRKEEVS